MKIKYYYARDNKNRPMITYCTVYKDNKVGIGVAICSELDHPVKKFGRRLAYSRAVGALNKKEHILPVGRYRSNMPLYKGYAYQQTTITFKFLLSIFKQIKEAVFKEFSMAC